MSATGVDGVVLAGGHSSRMQHDGVPVDKAWLMLAGLPLIEHVARNLGAQVDTVYLGTPHADARYRALGIPVPDGVETVGAAHGAVSGDGERRGGDGERRGPLAGVLAAMRASHAPWLAVAPCDTPFLPAAWVSRLHRAACDAGAPLALVSQGGLRQPVCMIVRTDLHTHLAQALAQGVRKVGQWQRQVGAVEVDFDDAPAHAFLNVNTPADLAQAQALVPPRGLQVSQRENS